VHARRRIWGTCWWRWLARRCPRRATRCITDDDKDDCSQSILYISFLHIATRCSATLLLLLLPLPRRLFVLTRALSNTFWLSRRSWRSRPTNPFHPIRGRLNRRKRMDSFVLSSSLRVLFRKTVSRFVPLVSSLTGRSGCCLAWRTRGWSNRRRRCRWSLNTSRAFPISVRWVGLKMTRWRIGASVSRRPVVFIKGYRKRRQCCSSSHPSGEKMYTIKRNDEKKTKTKKRNKKKAFVPFACSRNRLRTTLDPCGRRRRKTPPRPQPFMRLFARDLMWKFHRNFITFSLCCLFVINNNSKRAS